MRWITNAAVMLSLACLTACGGGTNPDPDPEPSATTINGTITITGAPLADLDDATAAGFQDEDKWAVWLIDPTEAVDNIALANDDDTFASSDIQNAGEYLLSVQVLPAVDLTGGVDPTTPVALSIPVSITEGGSAALVADISFLAPQAVSSLHTVSQAPDTSYRIRLHYSVSGATSAHELIELHWQNRALRRDTNNDGVVSDEADYADSNRDGISDGLYEYLEQLPHSQPHTLRGMITALDFGSSTIRVDDATIHVSEATRIQQGMRQLRLEELQVGYEVTISGYRDPSGRVFAQSIIVTRVQQQQPPH